MNEERVDEWITLMNVAVEAMKRTLIRIEESLSRIEETNNKMLARLEEM